jgi:sortase A
MSHPRRALVMGTLIALVGLSCLGGGIALLGWRLLEPDEAVLLPPGAAGTAEATPTPGLLGSPLAPPALRADQLAMLPVSPRESPVPATPTRTPPPSATSFAAATVPPANTARPTRRATPAPTLTHTATITVTVTASLTPTPAPSPTPPPTATPRPLIPERIVIDAIELDAPVVLVGQHAITLGGQTYSQWDVPNEYAAGWHHNSSPLNQPGNIVLNGHHNVYGAVFRHLIRLEPGDVVTLDAQGERHYYVVAQIMTLAEEYQPVSVRQENARWILPTDDERVTLVTCWPYNANSHRLVVVALPPDVVGLSDALP